MDFIHFFHKHSLSLFLSYTLFAQLVFLLYNFISILTLRCHFCSIRVYNKNEIHAYRMQFDEELIPTDSVGACFSSSIDVIVLTRDKKQKSIEMPPLIPWIWVNMFMSVRQDTIYFHSSIYNIRSHRESRVKSDPFAVGCVYLLLLMLFRHKTLKFHSHPRTRMH